MADYKAFIKDKIIEIKNVRTYDTESADSAFTNSVVVLNEQDSTMVLVDNRKFRIEVK